MKLRPKAECFSGNTFVLNEDSLPTQLGLNPWGKIMVWRKDVGWSVIQLRDVHSFLK